MSPKVSVLDITLTVFDMMKSLLLHIVPFLFLEKLFCNVVDCYFTFYLEISPNVPENVPIGVIQHTAWMVQFSSSEAGTKSLRI